MIGIEFLTAPAFATLVGMTDCERKPLPRIVTHYNTEKITYDTTKSHGQLANFSIDTISPYGAGVHTKVSGLMSGNINVSMSAEVAWTTNSRSQTSCIWYDKINIHITSKPTIYIAAEHDRNSCRYNVTHRHELKHVKVDNALLAKYKPKFEYEVKKAARNVGVIGPFMVQNLPQARADMNNQIQSAIQSTLNEMKQERKNRQQQVDSKREYDRLSKLCGGR